MMARIDAMIPDVLAKRLRITVAQRFGGRKGDLSKGLVEANLCVATRGWA